MKALVVSLVFLGFAFFLGCQDSITDPVTEPTYSSTSTDEEMTFDKDWFNIHYPNSIRLEGTLLDPSQRPNGYVQISGVVRYGITEVSTAQYGAEPIVNFNKTSPGNTPPLSNLKVDLYVSADLKGGFNTPWKVLKKDVAVISRSASSISVYYIEKSFRIQNTTNASLDLVLKFEVQNKDMKLVSQTLELVKGLDPIVTHN